MKTTQTKLIAVLISLLVSTNVFSAAADKLSPKDTMQLTFLSTYSQNQKLISNAECRALFPSSGVTANLVTDKNGALEVTTSNGVSFNNVKDVYRHAGASSEKTQPTWVHLKEGVLKFKLRNKMIETSAILSSIMPKNGKENLFALQSLYCAVQVQASSS